MDIDDFKVVNDQYGHDVGDKLLVELTENLKSVIRDKDIFCRIGGDEFAILIS
ncbi:GGDEF domain-containing protein [Anaerobacillus sp. HL2]|nr:GGDEF domain-containing protein [Anaerobacillus sp. HL2]